MVIASRWTYLLLYWFLECQINSAICSKIWYSWVYEFLKIQLHIYLFNKCCIDNSIYAISEYSSIFQQYLKPLSAEHTSKCSVDDDAKSRMRAQAMSIQKRRDLRQSWFVISLKRAIAAVLGASQTQMLFTLMIAQFLGLNASVASNLKLCLKVIFVKTHEEWDDNILIGHKTPFLASRCKFSFLVMSQCADNYCKETS